MARESEIDATIPADNEKVDKSEVRANFGHAKDEIDDLYRYTGLAWQIATNIKSMSVL